VISEFHRQTPPDLTIMLRTRLPMRRIRRADERTRTADLLQLRVITQALQGVQRCANHAFLSSFLSSDLPNVAPYCVPGGIRVVSARGHKLLASLARVAAGSCKLVGGDGPAAQQVSVRAARRGSVPALAPPQPPERRPDQRPSARPRSPLAPRASRSGSGGCARSGRPRTPLAAGAFR
jgi:hypothetical protein